MPANLGDDQLPPTSDQKDDGPPSSKQEPPVSSQRPRILDQTMAAGLPMRGKRQRRPTPLPPVPIGDSNDSITFAGAEEQDRSKNEYIGIGPQGTMIVPLSSTPSPQGKELPIPAEGTRIGGDDGKRFEILERLGAGGMAVVLLAKDTVLDRTVAIKFVTHEVLGAAGSEVVERFRFEAVASARLSHENIVRIFDLGMANGVPFLVMEHLDGRPLDSIELHHELTTLRAVRIMTDVARGLSHAHKAGIVHRDLKPGNVFIVKEGRAKIVDFGLASIAFGLDSRGTEWLALAGTPRYMSPEQWKGEPQDGRTDIWAAGVMLFEMLAGRPPFPGESIFDVRSGVLSNKPAPALKIYRPDLPEEASRLVERLLSKDVTKRAQTADELLDGLVALEVALNRASRAATQEARTESRARHEPERRQATFLSCALSDLMRLSEELVLDDFSDLLDGFFELCSTVVRQLDGIILSSLGGRVVACFGYPVAHEDDAQRAVRAGLLIADAIQSWTRKDGSPHVVQIGVHTNLAIASSVQGAGGSQAILQGEAPHVAMWLEENAAPGEMLMTGRTHALVRGLFETEQTGERLLAGASRPIETYRALRPASSATRFEHGAAETRTPLVGREHEKEELRGAWKRAKSGEGQLVMLSGEAGIGKSRLVEHLKDDIALDPHHLVSCQSWLHFKNTALYPVASGLRRMMGLQPETPAAEQLHKLETFLSELGIALDENVPLLASLLSIPLSKTYVVPSLSPDLLKGKVLEATITTLLRLAAEEPTVLLMEDVHWSDASTIELLGLLQARLQTVRLLLLVTFRPDFTPPWAERANVHRLALTRLSSSQTAAMAAFATQGRHLPREIVDHLIRRTDGIPLFVEELTRMVADAWEQAIQSGQEVNVQSFASSTIPTGLSELLLARLDRLADNGKEVAQLGAVLGREFSHELILRAASLGENALRSGLMQLIEAGVLRHSSEGDKAQYVFKHALLQDAAYQSLVKGRRKEHHYRAAKALVDHFPEDTALHPELVGHHFSEAGYPSDAVVYFEKAGQRAGQRFANADAVTHYFRALDELKILPAGSERDRRELALQLALGPALMSTRGHAGPQVRETFERARELCEVAGDHSRLFPAMLGLTYAYMVGGEPETSAQLGEQLISMAEQSGDLTMKMLAHRQIGPIFLLLGQLVLCRHHSEKALNLYDREKHSSLAPSLGVDPSIGSTGHLSSCLLFMGLPDEALSRTTDAVSFAKKLDHPASLVFATHFLAGAHNHRAEHEIARAVSERGLKLAEEHKLAMWISMFKIQLGWAICAMGEHASGVSLLEDGISGWSKAGGKAGLTFHLAPLIWALSKAGQLDAAMRTIEKADALVIEQRERCFEAELLRLRGEVMLARDAESVSGAIECFRRGIEVARKHEARLWELRNAKSLVRVLSDQGRAEEGLALLKRAVDWHKEGLDTAELLEAKELLTTMKH